MAVLADHSGQSKSRCRSGAEIGKIQGMLTLHPVPADHPLLQDESRWSYACPERVVFPESESDLREVLADAARRELAVYVQGAKTGVTSASIPSRERAVLISMSRFPATIVWSGARTVTVSPSVSLAELEQEARTRSCIFGPNPTESSAMLGGAIACNASGSRSFAFGSVRPWVRRLKVMLVDGEVLTLQRGAETENDDASQRLGSRLVPPCTYPMPACKNAAGYHSGSELIDRLIGSEGTLGITLEAELALLPLPELRLPMVVFFESEDQAHRFILDTRRRCRDPRDALKSVMLEFIGRAILERLPPLTGTPSQAKAAVMLEHWATADAPPAEIARHYGAETDETIVLGAWAEQMLRHGAIADPHDATFPQLLIALGADQRRALEAFRHKIPETMNAVVARAGFPKLATDCAVPDAHYDDVVALYRRHFDPSGLEWYYFGHAGDNHFHVNIITHNAAEFARANQLYGSICREVVALGGTVSAEHGIGKNKRPYLELMYPQGGIAHTQMLAVKRAFDPGGRLNPDALFPSCLSDNA